jgi:hypothetical protein
VHKFVFRWIVHTASKISALNILSNQIFQTTLMYSRSLCNGLSEDNLYEWTRVVNRSEDNFQELICSQHFRSEKALCLWTNAEEDVSSCYSKLMWKPQLRISFKALWVNIHLIKCCNAGLLSQSWWNLKRQAQSRVVESKLLEQTTIEEFQMFLAISEVQHLLCNRTKSISTPQGLWRNEKTTRTICWKCKQE